MKLKWPASGEESRIEAATQGGVELSVVKICDFKSRVDRTVCGGGGGGGLTVSLAPHLYRVDLIAVRAPCTVRTAKVASPVRVV
jgi:hypothetical protein